MRVTPLKLLDDEIRPAILVTERDKLSSRLTVDPDGDGGGEGGHCGGRGRIFEN